MKGTIYRTTKPLSLMAGVLMLAAALMMTGCKQNITTAQVSKDTTPSAGKQGEYRHVAYSDLDEYLKNTASSTGLNYITVTGLSPALVTGEFSGTGDAELSPLGKILRAHSDKRVALTLSAVTALGDLAFVNCTSLTSVTIPASVQSIGDSAFYGCTNAEIVFSEGIDVDINIGEVAFGNDYSTGLCKNVKIRDDANYEAIKGKVAASGYPENRIEKY